MAAMQGDSSTVEDTTPIPDSQDLPSGRKTAMESHARCLTKREPTCCSYKPCYQGLTESVQPTSFSRRSKSASHGKGED